MLEQQREQDDGFEEEHYIKDVRIEQLEGELQAIKGRLDFYKLNGRSRVQLEGNREHNSLRHVCSDSNFFPTRVFGSSKRVSRQQSRTLKNSRLEEEEMGRIEEGRDNKHCRTENDQNDENVQYGQYGTG